MNRSERLLGRVADTANITPADIRALIETIVDEHLGLIPREQSDEPHRKTGARLVFGEGHATLSYISDPEGTDVVPRGYEPPPGYHGL